MTHLHRSSPPPNRHPPRHHLVHSVGSAQPRPIGFPPGLPLTSHIAGLHHASALTAPTACFRYLLEQHTLVLSPTRMCTQELIWCSCGHGELLPIVKCSTAELTGVCWTVVHGDHRLVVDMKCSFCTSGLKGRLGDAARPQGELAGKIEGVVDQVKEEGKEKEEEGKQEEDGLLQTAEEIPWELDDVMNTDWSEFCLDPELWQYT